jgi:hypothetical protein
MKESPSEKELRDRLGPSKFSGEGFLSSDTRPVMEIISTDLAVLEMSGVTPEQIAVLFTEIYDKAVKGFGAEVEVLPDVYGKYNESMGKIPSPFTGEGVFPKGEVVVRYSASGDEIVLTPLSIHLIKAHGFFQGRGSRYRIEPEKAAALLRLKQ